MIHTERQGAVEVIHVDGPLNQHVVEELEEVLQACQAGGQPMIVLDGSLLQLIDSTGLELLVRAQQTMTQRGGMIKLAGLSPLCTEILRATGVGQQFETYMDVKRAIGSYAR